MLELGARLKARGLIGSIVAKDAMLKSADVRLVKQEKVDAAPL